MNGSVWTTLVKKTLEKVSRLRGAGREEGEKKKEKHKGG